MPGETLSEYSTPSQLDNYYEGGNFKGAKVQN